MVKKYSKEPSNKQKSAKTSASDLRVHFKNTYETVKAIKGKTIKKAQKYLQDVLAHRRCIPFTRFNGHVGRTGQAIEFGSTQGRWPEKSVKVVLGLLQNLEANSQTNSLNPEKTVIMHAQVNRAQKGRRRTYRAHAYLNSGCHIEMWAQAVDEDVKKEKKTEEPKLKLSKVQSARGKFRKLPIGAQ